MRLCIRSGTVFVSGWFNSRSQFASLRGLLYKRSMQMQLAMVPSGRPDGLRNKRRQEKCCDIALGFRKMTKSICSVGVVRVARVCCRSISSIFIAEFLAVQDRSIPNGGMNAHAAYHAILSLARALRQHSLATKSPELPVAEVDSRSAVRPTALLLRWSPPEIRRISLASERGRRDCPPL